jgi:hypothetical protein
MGMSEYPFDEVVILCPECSTPNIIQSKAGDCCLASYSLDTAPTVIIADIANEPMYCNECNTRYKLAVKVETKIVPITDEN